jgi:hypothetical protein
MKNSIKLNAMGNIAKIIALVAVIGFSITACPQDNVEEDSLNGTWVSANEKMVLNNGDIVASVDDIEALKGTYTTSGKNITITFTHVKGAIIVEELGTLMASTMGITKETWYTQNDLTVAAMQAMVALNPDLDLASLTPEQIQAILEAMSEEVVGEEMGDSGYGLDQPVTGTYALNGDTLTITVDGETTTFIRQK